MTSLLLLESSSITNKSNTAGKSSRSYQTQNGVKLIEVDWKEWEFLEAYKFNLEKVLHYSRNYFAEKRGGCVMHIKYRLCNKLISRT
jgi:hypothetical protein